MAEGPKKANEVPKRSVSWITRRYTKNYSIIFQSSHWRVHERFSKFVRNLAGTKSKSLIFNYRKNKERISAYAEKTTVKHGTEKFKTARLVVKNKDKVFTFHGSSEDIMKAIENAEEEERRSQRRITNSWFFLDIAEF